MNKRERDSVEFEKIKQLFLDVHNQDALKHEHLLKTLKHLVLEDLVKPHEGVGRKPHNRLCLARAFVAKAVYGHATTKILLDVLQTDAQLRQTCGWETGNDVPNESTFSRAFSEFFVQSLPKKIHERLT
jgi:hypothetical protein